MGSDYGQTPVTKFSYLGMAGAAGRNVELNTCFKVWSLAMPHHPVSHGRGEQFRSFYLSIPSCHCHVFVRMRKKMAEI